MTTGSTRNIFMMHEDTNGWPNQLYVRITRRMDGPYFLTLADVLNATTVEATSSSNGVGLLYTKSDLPIGLGAFKKTPVEKAIRNAVEAAVNHIAATKL